MKTINKLMVAWIATTAVLALTAWTSLAMYGQWGWQWNGGWQGFGKTLTTEQRAEMQSMSETERQEYVQQLKSEQGISTQWQWSWKGKWGQWNWGWEQAKQSGHEWNAGDSIVNIPAQDMDDAEIDLLLKQYEEETMANELYTYFYEMYGVETFKNIADSEAQHQKALEAIFDRYNVELPTWYAHIQELYDTLKAKGELSLKDALEVWVSIEIVDIDDIVTAIKTTDNDDFQTILVNIGWGSYNHLRWFLKALSNNGLTTDIEYSDYLTEDLANSKWSIKYLLAEKLEAEWFDLPDTASSSKIKENCDNKEGHGNEQSSSMNKGKQGEMKSSENRNVNSTLKNQYKTSLQEKYGEKISTLDNEKLESVVVKIDDLLEKLNSWKYSSSTVQKYNATLYALREIVVENIEMDELNLDSIFE